MKRVLLIILILFGTSLFAQRTYKITVDKGGKIYELSYMVKNGMDYISCRGFASLFGANIFYNQDNQKLEIKFENHTIKFTAHNQFVVLSKNENKIQSVFQLPVSTLPVRDDIYVPLLYAREYLVQAAERSLEYDSQTKNLIVTSRVTEEDRRVVSKEDETKDDVVDTAGNEKYDLYDIIVDEKANGTMIRLKANKQVRVPRNSINDGILFIFFPNTSIKPKLDEKIKPAGLIKSVKQTFISPKNVQFEFILNEGYSKAEVFREEETNDLLITIHNKIFNPVPALPEAKAKWNFDCVVIDAGHGGKDPGTIGVKGTREKDINLAIALKLGNMIRNNLEGVKVVYTRSTDEFIELYKRGKIANEAGGKLFISIHCNSTESKDNGVRGFEVYLLRPGRTKEAIRIAELENSVISYEENPDRYDKLTDENFILVSMAHSQFMRYSETFSDILNQEWKKGTEIPSLGIKQAGFYVLVGASMPGVLVEAGFLSNRKDEAYLNSRDGQTSVAESLFNAVKKYKEHYEKEISN